MAQGRAHLLQYATAEDLPSFSYQVRSHFLTPLLFPSLAVRPADRVGAGLMYVHMGMRPMRRSVTTMHFHAGQNTGFDACFVLLQQPPQ